MKLMATFVDYSSQFSSLLNYVVLIGFLDGESSMALTVMKDDDDFVILSYYS